MKLNFPARQKVKRVHTLADRAIVCVVCIAKAVKFVACPPCNFIVYMWHGHRATQAFKMAFGIN